MSFWSSGSESAAGFSDGEFSDAADHFAEFEQGYAAEQQQQPVGVVAATYGDYTTSKPGTPVPRDDAGEPSWLSSFNAPPLHGAEDGVREYPKAPGRRPSITRRPSAQSSTGSHWSSVAADDAVDAAGGRSAVRRRSSVTFLFDEDTSRGPHVEPQPAGSSSSRRSSVSSLGGIDGLDGWDPSAPENDADDPDDASHDGLFSQRRLIHDAAEWRDNGLVFADLPACPPDADASYFLDPDFVAAAVEADANRRASFAPAAVRRYFEESGRASRMERERVAERARAAEDEEAAFAASPLGRSINASSRLLPSSSSLRRAPSIAGSSAYSPLTARGTGASSIIGGGLRRTGTVASARTWRSPSPATSEDSLDRWRKTVATPPRRSPTPSAPETGGTTGVVLVADTESPAASSGFMLSRPGGGNSAAPRSPRALLDGHHLLACLRPTEIDALVNRNVVCRATFPAGTRFTTHRCLATPSHVLILIRGCVEVQNGSGVAVGAVDSPGHALLEDEARAVIAGHRRPSPATLIVAAGSEAEAWCVPLQLYRRVVALSRGINRAVTRLSRMESRASLHGSPPYPMATM